MAAYVVLREGCTTVASHCSQNEWRKMTAEKKMPDADRPVTLKILAEYLDLSPATISIVLNDSPVAKSIPAATRQRVLAAAKKFDYLPNLHARTLRTGITNTV